MSFSVDCLEFSSKYEFCLKDIVTETVFIMTEKLIFFKIVPFALNEHIPASFPLVEAPLKLFYILFLMIITVSSRVPPPESTIVEMLQ